MFGGPRPQTFGSHLTPGLGTDISNDATPRNDRRGVKVPNERPQRARTCPFLAGECQVIVAGYVVPLAPLMPDHHHAVLSRLEETVRLVWPPVVKLLWENMFSFHVCMLRP